MRVELAVELVVADDKIISFMLSATISAMLAFSNVSSVSSSMLPSTTSDSVADAAATSSTLITGAGAGVNVSSYGCANSFSIFLKRSSRC